MDRIIFRHLTGSKANQVEEFPLGQIKELLIGRDPTNTIKYDPDRDDLVGRQHAKIDQDPNDPHRFMLTDLNSRNGTFLNKQRITGTVALSPGDMIQLGPGGPEFQFDLDPRPAHLVKATRVADQVSSQAPPTREVEVAGTAARPPGTVGKETVERMVGEVQTKASKKMYVLTAAVVLVVAILAWALISRWSDLGTAVSEQQAQLDAAERARPMSATEIAAKYTESTVFIEVGWKLIYTESGEQLFHEYYSDTGKDAQGRAQPPAPIFIQLQDGSIEPSLALGRGESGANQPIGQQGSGSGFVVTNDGFILTNRHVAAAWETSYSFPQGPALLVKLGSDKPEWIQNPPYNWVPANAKVIGRALTGKNVEGRLDYLDVTFAKNKLRIPASLTRVSDQHDVAMVKVDVPQPVTKVELYDNYDQVQAGAPITVMGYPGASPMIAVMSRSQDVFSREGQTRTVPDPTISPGTIGRVIRGQMRPEGGQVFDYWSEFGDTYQLDTTSTGQGNSGGPVFDDRGRVIGILFAGRQRSGAMLSFAVPIRFGLELMGISATIR